ncbi:MAG: hypothetical protein P4L57_09260, partial [Rhizomicrobium sp.]|nr:hypothetical protein [Rhizomicrobium sp.]
MSYETAQLANPDFFSRANTELIGFVRRLGASGVLRIGGNTSAYSVWTPDGAPAAGSEEIAGPDTGNQAAPRRPVTPLAIKNLRDFIDATGWKLVYGLNMGTESPQSVAAEADCVAKTMGSKLVAFQLCNEPDLFARNGVRGPDYNFEQFATEWQRFFEAVRSRVPGAPFAGPDTAFNNEWLVPFASRFKKDVLFLSQHYYAEGPPTDPTMTIGRLLRPNPTLQDEFNGMVRTRQNSGLAFRMAETNSCYKGGKQGVSNTFASALWGADLMYQLAANGGTGINFHGGGYGWYTPIAGTPTKGFQAQPLYYAMLLFAQGGSGQLVETQMTGGADTQLVTAYGLKNNDGTLKAAIFNKDEERDVRLTIDPGSPATHAMVQRLSAPRIDDTANTTFGGAAVGAGGVWAAA